MTESCASYPVDPAGIALPLPERDLEAIARALPNGSALIFGQVAPDARSLALRFVGGRTKRMAPKDGTFAVAMSAEEVIGAIVLHLPDEKLRCSLDRKLQMYRCDSRAPAAPVPTVPGGIPPVTAVPQSPSP